MSVTGEDEVQYEGGRVKGSLSERKGEGRDLIMKEQIV